MTTNPINEADLLEEFYTEIIKGNSPFDSLNKKQKERVKSSWMFARWRFNKVVAPEIIKVVDSFNERFHEAMMKLKNRYS